MWFYFLAHCAYHFTRWFPKGNRKAVRIVVIMFSLLFLVPQIYVSLLKRSSRYCEQPLLNISVACIVFTFAMIAFSFLFTMMEPVPWQLKIAFHFFGFGSLLMGLVLFASIMDTNHCETSVPELYYLCLSFGIFAILSTGFLMLMLPFWLVNYLWPDSVLNRRERRGICYEPAFTSSHNASVKKYRIFFTVSSKRTCNSNIETSAKGHVSQEEEGNTAKPSVIDEAGENTQTTRKGQK